uniref:Uncharacterized protein n=1 Tax=Rhizophora mucronata TaxID=61149 RepID=A0A2P2MXV3_RHIMU
MKTINYGWINLTCSLSMIWTTLNGESCVNSLFSSTRYILSWLGEVPYFVIDN